MKNGDSKPVPNTILKSIRVQNYRSLRDVTLYFRPLTIIVGPNASGKSNCLAALWLLGRMMSAPELPSRTYIKDNLWIDGAKEISFDVDLECAGKAAHYSLSIAPTRRKTPVKKESLSIAGTEVISVNNGKGFVCNEDGSESIPYQGVQLALKSAGSYGDRPITNAVAQLIQDWEFYDVDPSFIRGEMSRLQFDSLEQSGRLDRRGLALSPFLSHWAARDPAVLRSINEGMRVCGGTELEISGGRNKKLHLEEGLSKTLPLDHASDGTLRLLFYNALSYQPNLPSLIGIEEPERNLHPAALVQLGQLLEQLARKTQVIITTHSSQLVDCFSVDNLSKDLAVILLRKQAAQGTEALSVDKIRSEREALQDWMNDFGIGNAIFHSQLLQDLVGS